MVIHDRPITPHQQIKHAAQQYASGVLAKLRREVGLLYLEELYNAVQKVSKYKPNVAAEFYAEVRDFTVKKHELERVAIARGLEKVFEKHPAAVRYFQTALPSNPLAENREPTPYEQLEMLKSQGISPKDKMYEIAKEMKRLQYEMSKHVPGVVPKPKRVAVERVELVVTLLIAGAFLGLLTYFKNPPGTAGYAALPNYGTTTILLSIIVLAALIFLFKKTR